MYTYTPTDTVTQAKREAAMLREIANSEARGVDWSTNLNASADFLEGIAHQPDSALVEEMSAVIEHFNNLLAMREDCDTCTTWSGRTQDIGSYMADSRDTLRKAAKFLKALGGSNAD